MYCKFVRFIFIYFISVTLIFTPLAWAEPEAPSQDLQAPELNHEPDNTPLQRGADRKVQASVVDNEGVQSVVLFYRSIGETSYKQMDMQREGETDNYSATLSSAEIQAAGLEYYIQATDHSGNTVQHGISFSPVKISLQEKPQAIDANSTTREAAALDIQVPPASYPNERLATTQDRQSKAKKDSKSSSYMTWIYVGLGVLLVAGLAGGGGGGGGSDDGEGDVVINAPAP